jgi:hypothetical protein
MSQYAQEVKNILASLHQPEDEQQPLPDEEPVPTLYVYKTEQGGVVLSPTRIEGDEDPQDETVIDSQEPQPAARREPPYFFYFVFILLVFLVLDVANSQLIALMTPTVNITITPTVKTITLTSSMRLGKVLSPLTLTESQTVSTSGHGHQEATHATGTLTLYNGSFSSQTMNAGTVYTGSDGVQVAIDQTVTIPAANPPYVGQATVTAHAIQVGASGNIQAGDISITGNTLQIRNTQFQHGQDARDFQKVTKADRDTTVAILQAKVTASMIAALQGQLTAAEQLQMKPCRPSVTADHGVGEEATQLTVTVSETCTAVAYNAQDLTTQATRLLTTQATKKIGSGYMLYGNVQVTVTKATTTTNTTAVLLSFTTQGTYVYQLTTKAQQDIKTLIAGKPRETALRQLVTLPGLSHVSINGVPDDQRIPDDVTHIHILILVQE